MPEVLVSKALSRTRSKHGKTGESQTLILARSSGSSPDCRPSAYRWAVVRTAGAKLMDWDFEVFSYVTLKTYQNTW